jgi:hypothetical protein
MYKTKKNKANTGKTCGKINKSALNIFAMGLIDFTNLTALKT